MEVDNGNQERRSQKRKKVKISFLIKIGILFNGRGIAKDINQYGVCLICPQLFKLRNTIQPKDYIGEALRIMIPSDNITINGVIAWVDIKKGEGGIRITSTSNDKHWQEVYEKSL